MNKTILGMAAVVVILVVIALVQGGLPMVGRGFAIAGETFINVLPLLVVAFIVAGLTSTVMPKKTVSRWLGEDAGWKGPLLGSLMGAMVPGGPYFFYPLMASLIVSGANVGTMISFVAAKTLWNVGRIPLEFAFVGVRLTLIRYLITFSLPILMGGLVNTFLPGFAARIGEDVERLQKTKLSLKGGERR